MNCVMNVIELRIPYTCGKLIQKLGEGGDRGKQGELERGKSKHDVRYLLIIINIYPKTCYLP